MVAFSTLAGLALGAAGTAYAANKSSKAVKNAATLANDASTQANAVQERIYQGNKATLTPIIERGNVAGDRLSALLGLGGDEAGANDAFNKYLESTGYKFERDQGRDAITSSRAASGSLNSGATLKALNDYGADSASRYFRSYLSDVGGVANTGLNAAGALAGAGRDYASQVGANLRGAADTSANAGLAGASIQGQAVNSGMGALGQYMGGRSSYASPQMQPFDPFRAAGAY